MKNWIIFLVTGIGCLLSPLSLSAIPIDLTNSLNTAIGLHVELLAENDVRLELEEVIAAFNNKEGTQVKSPVLSFGIDSDPVWIRFEVINPRNASLKRRLSIETPWIDSIDVFFRRGGRTVAIYTAGDTRPYSGRPIDNQFFVFDHSFEPGISSVYIRVETPDPMVLPIFVMTPQESLQRGIARGYNYGFIYGVLVALLAYNLILFFSLKNSRYFYYVIYLSAFVLANLAYTGHAYEWFWPSSPGWQRWASPVTMVLYAVAGLLFASKFLETKQRLPRIHLGVLVINVAVVLLLSMAIIFSSQVFALYVAFIFLLVFPVIMLLLGAISLNSGLKSAKYFLLAAITAMGGAITTVLAVMGTIPYNIWTYHCVEIGMLVEAVLLALALSDHFRITLEEKLQAEKLASVDPLTGINNRRGFYKFVEPILSTANRNKRDISMILFDIDRFKIINDTYGHVIGDKVLMEIANLLKNSARGGDVIARWGGEEFVILLPETNLKESVSLAERLRVSLSEILMQIKTDEISFTASFGVASMNSAIKSFDELVEVADKHLYRAKNQGRNRVCFEDLVVRNEESFA